MKGWTITCKFIGEGKSIVADITQDAYESYVETDNTFEACFHDIGLFVDEAFRDHEVHVSMRREIIPILLDFLKKTSSFDNIIKTGLPYAAFTFLRSSDWTEDAQNYRYRFLGAHKDQHSDHKLWAGNKYFCSDDYHAESYAHKYMKGIFHDPPHGDIDTDNDDTSLLLSGRRDTNMHQAGRRFVIDIPEKVDSLMSHLKKALPIPTSIPASLAKELSEKSPGIIISRRCDIIDVIYAGDEGGILCCLDFASNDPHLVYITFLSFNRTHPLTREIEAYQRHRIKRMRKQPTYH